MTTTDKISIYSDGGSRGNPGPAAFAFVVYKAGKIIYKNSKFLGKTTNNVAEYEGARHAVRWLKENEDKIKGFKINIFLDSQLVVKQLTGEYKIKNQKLIPLAREIKGLEREIENKIIFHFIKREKNKVADGLLNEKLDETLGN
jgi:ribonuclease HI